MRWWCNEADDLVEVQRFRRSDHMSSRRTPIRVKIDLRRSGAVGRVGKAKRPRECAVDGVPTIAMCWAAGSVGGHGAKGAFAHPTAAPILTHMGERRDP